MSETIQPSPPLVAGLSLSGATPYKIDPEENRRLCESVGLQPAKDGSAHPIYFFIATQVGMRLTVAELCAACEFDVNDGPMMASSKADFTGVLRTGTQYYVQGQIRSLIRKPSRKFGVIDMLDFQLQLVDESQSTILACSHIWVLPRRAHA